MKLGKISLTEALQIDRVFSDIADDTMSYLIDVFNIKKGQYLLVMAREPRAEYPSKDVPMFVKVTKVCHMSESCRVSNGEVSWNIGNPRGIVVDKNCNPKTTPRYD